MVYLLTRWIQEIYHTSNNMKSNHLGLSKTANKSNFLNRNVQKYLEFFQNLIPVLLNEN